MGRSLRSQLIEALRRHILPVFEQSGFTLVPLTDEERRSELRTAFPVGRLRRHTDEGFDIIEIQFDRHRSTAFRINIGKVPVSGIASATGHVAAEDVWVGYLDRFCTLYAQRMFRRWFYLKGGSDDVATTQAMNELLSHLLTLLPQIEQFLTHGRRGRNLRCV